MLLALFCLMLFPTAIYADGTPATQDNSTVQSEQSIQSETPAQNEPQNDTVVKDEPQGAPAVQSEPQSEPATPAEPAVQNEPQGTPQNDSTTAAEPQDEPQDTPQGTPKDGSAQNNDASKATDEKQDDSPSKSLKSTPRLESTPKSIYVSEDGNNETGNGSAENPYKTIAHACAQSSAGDIISLLTDILQREVVGIWHSLTIDGQGHSVIRQEGFATTSDTARSWYNPAMFEVHSDDGNTTVTFKNITLDDNFLHEGTKYQDQNVSPADTSDNLNRVQDGIVSLYSFDNKKTTVIFDEGCTLQNFGGVNAVNIEGNSELVMKNGSVITNNSQNPNGTSFANSQAVLALAGGTVTMEQGSLITGINGPNAIFTNDGNAVINGEITNCNGTSPLRSTGKSTVTLGKSGTIHDLQGCGVGALYAYGGATTYNIDGKIYNIPGRGGIWASNSDGHIINITDNAEFYGITGQAIRSDQGIHVYMTGGSMHDNGTAIFARRRAHIEMTGGSIKNNNYGIYLAHDDTRTARVFIKENADVSGNTHDYFIQSNALGYPNGSYIYFDEKQTAKDPTVEMQMDNKLVTLKPSNGHMYVGNASNPSKTALNEEADRLGLANKLATLWFRNDQGLAEFLISNLTPNSEPAFALYVPVNADGTVAGDVCCIKVTPDVLASLSTSANENGYSVLIAQGDVPVYEIKIVYVDEEGNGLQNPHSEECVKDANYDVTALTNPKISGYYFDSLTGDAKGTASENVTLTSVYKAIKDLVVEALSDEVTYDGQYHDLSGLKQVTFEIDGETYTVSGLETETLSEKNYKEGGYELTVKGTPTVTDSQGNDVTDHFNVTTKPGLLMINRANVVVKADDKTKTVGENDPAFTATVDGLVDGDSISYGFSRKDGESAGTYDITPNGEEVQGNYNVTYENGTLTIAAAPAPATEGEPSQTKTVDKKTVTHTKKTAVVSHSYPETGDEGIAVYMGMLLAAALALIFVRKTCR